MRGSRRRTRKQTDFWDRVNRAIVMFEYKHHLPVRGIVQVGGGEFEDIIDVSGHRYYYKTSTKGYSYTILGGRRKGRRPCIILFYNAKTKIANLQMIERGDDCSLDFGTPSRQTVLAAVAIAQKLGASRLLISDESSKNIPGDLSFDLSLMYFLSTGKTWYESILPGLRPENPALIESERAKVLSNTWASVAERFPELVVPVDISDIDTSVPGSAMRVFRRIKDARTTFFADYDAALSRRSLVNPLKGKTWYLDL